MQGLFPKREITPSVYLLEKNYPAMILAVALILGNQQESVVAVIVSEDYIAARTVAVEYYIPAVVSEEGTLTSLDSEIIQAAEHIYSDNITLLDGIKQAEGLVVMTEYKIVLRV